MAWIADLPRFVASFIRDPLTVGAVAPSSRWLAKRMVADMGLREARTVVEVGPGTGAFTSKILDEIGPSTWFMAIELNPAFVDSLRLKFPGTRIVQDSAEHLADHLGRDGPGPADAILSSLPWAGFPKDLQRKLMAAMVAGLRPGGRFCTFAYLHAAWFKRARRFRELLESSFKTVAVTKVVWRNLPPAFVYRCEK